MDLTLLEISQIFGEKALSIFKKYGTKAAITDFPILLGGYVSDLTLNNSDELKDRTGYYWTKTDDRDNDAHCVHDNGWSDYSNRVYNRRLGIRPTLLFVSIPSVSLNEVRGNDGVLRVEYGEYPQYAVDKIE